MGTPSAAAIAVSISARVAMLFASSSGSSSERAAGNTPTATAASGIVPAHCGPPTASGFHLCSVNLGSEKDRWRRVTVMHAAGPLVLETLAVSTQQGSKQH